MKIILALALTLLGVSCTTYEVRPTRHVYHSSGSGVSVSTSPESFDHVGGIR